MSDKKDESDLTGGSEFEFESQTILPGELADNEKVQEAYQRLNNSLQEKLNELKKENPSKHYFHANIGNRMSAEGGKEIEIKIVGTQTIIEFNYRGSYDKSDPKALERINAVSLILKSDISTGKQDADLEFFREGSRHIWKTKSHGNDFEIEFQQSDSDSKDIANILLITDIDCLSLLTKPNQVESAHQPPKIGGLAEKPNRKNQARWN